MAWRAFCTMSACLGKKNQRVKSQANNRTLPRPSRSTCRVQEPSKVLCVKRAEMQRLVGGSDSCCADIEPLQTSGCRRALHRKQLLSLVSDALEENLPSFAASARYGQNCYPPARASVEGPEKRRPTTDEIVRRTCSKHANGWPKMWRTRW